MIWIEKKARMRLKRHHRMRRAEIMGNTAGSTDHMLMPVMNTVKITQGDNTVARLGRQVRKVTKNTHKPRLLLLPGRTVYFASGGDGEFIVAPAP